MANFETPYELSKTEIKLLQNESERVKISDNMEKRLADKNLLRSFLKEYTNYIERSLNEQSKHRIDQMFRRILFLNWIRLENMEEGIERAYSIAQNKPGNPIDGESKSEQLQVSIPDNIGENGRNKEDIINDNYSYNTIPPLTFEEWIGDETSPKLELYESILDWIVPNVPLNAQEQEVFIPFEIDFNEILSNSTSSLIELKNRFLSINQSKVQEDGEKINPRRAKEFASIIDYQESGLLDWLFDVLTKIIINTDLSFPIITNENRHEVETKKSFSVCMRQLFQSIQNKVVSLVESKYNEFEKYRNFPKSSAEFKKFHLVKTLKIHLHSKQIHEEEMEIVFWKIYDRIIGYWSFSHRIENLNTTELFFWNMWTDIHVIEEGNKIEPYKEQIDEIYESIKDYPYKGSFSKKSRLPFCRNKKRIEKVLNDDVKYCFSIQKWKGDDWESNSRNITYNIERISSKERILIRINNEGVFKEMTFQDVKGTKIKEYESWEFTKYIGRFNSDVKAVLNDVKIEIADLYLWQEIAML